ncbi:putative thiol-specific monooxygenase [Clavispora lusitaniae]|uniref:Thiol-specific monooxygenase n=1 Tax=Clavispora lusitaniae TaxID=36911 RepID=A0ACD0WIT9_CLALS|nr:putative thiol-specific monooxygenase [Clavispora lusitaniae]QFZ33517.1 putative thiol-specific monooxygenase [Clavispora lusitaniae]QFZ39188.1 putative thiol-specific monooxygenase [Clavispora lusitaniae]QFZ44870.1 putative thiol-specific monooxygenase [Clavispora lusitaniae]QFZ50547.1 putative thiol-specific monooxygenase [Clavispora lusitaniae]
MKTFVIAETYFAFRESIVLFFPSLFFPSISLFHFRPIMSLRRIAIIGGGPAGLAAAKALVSEPVKFTIDLFERRSNVGGLWYYHGDKSKVLPSVPSVDPNGGEVLLPNGGFENRFFSPMYNHLETNLIDRMMEFKDVPFEPRHLAYLSRSEVQEYMLKYAASIPEGVNFHLNTSVTRVFKENGEWSVSFEDVKTQEAQEKKYDAVIVSNGHSDLPFIPDTEGISDWNEKAPGTVTHAKYYVDAEQYWGKNVLVIGNYASGVDLATQISTTAKHVYVSMKDQSELIEIEEDNVSYLQLVTKYDYDANKSAYTIDGKTVSNIDVIVFCTGYLYTLPFLNDYLPGITDGNYVKDLYKQIFNVEDPTLSFIGLPKFIVPMPLSESQSAIVARVYSGRIHLPTLEERKASYEEEIATKGTGKPFHSLKPPADYTYCNELYDWIKKENTDDAGLVPIYWDSQKIKDRHMAKEIKDKRYLEVVEYAKKLKSEGKAFVLPPRAQPIDYE